VKHQQQETQKQKQFIKKGNKLEKLSQRKQMEIRTEIKKI
jgi:hypothetical protein